MSGGAEIAVVGAGAWGTALALHAARLGARVSLWSRTPLPGQESPHLPGFVLPDAITPTTRLPRGGEVIILAVPVQHLRAVAARLDPQAPLLAASKGLEAATLRLPLEILGDLHPSLPRAVLTGPNFAHEVAAGLPAASVVAATDPGLRARLIGLLGSPSLRLYGNDDPLGAQLGGAAKNVIAIAAGAVTGAALGENARAALITRGLAELGRLVAAEGGRAETVAGLSGLGDLLLTCTGPASRNFRCGVALAQGQSLATILAGGGGVIEGVHTAPALVERARGTELPVCQAVARLLAGRSTIPELMGALMGRPARDE